MRQICTLPNSLVKCTPESVLQMSKTDDWNYYLGTAVMNSVCQDLCVGCCKLLTPFLSQSDCQWLGPVDSPAFFIM